MSVNDISMFMRDWLMIVLMLMRFRPLPAAMFVFVMFVVNMSVRMRHGTMGVSNYPFINFPEVSGSYTRCNRQKCKYHKRSVQPLGTSHPPSEWISNKPASMRKCELCSVNSRSVILVAGTF